MCGIAGVVESGGRPTDRALLRAMTDTLAHRGPDGEGFHVDGPVGLGHRRLSIIDLATGGQPMASADGSVWITYNGELYNFRELRAELEARGLEFRTTSDTEVFLRAYETWGTDCLRRLRGMFAAAIWDGPRRRLFLARDRVGIKPLVYAWDGRRLTFASELKALLEDPGLSRALDWDALAEYLAFRYVPCPRTIFAAARKLPPASYLVWDVDRGEPRVHRYWELALGPTAPGTRYSDDDWIEGLRAQLADAVESHLVSDVPVGAFLSGGMDSSTVVALMARAAPAPVRTFSIGFGEADHDELAYARLVARRFGTEHYEHVVKPDALEALPRLAWQFDEPFADASAIPTYYVSKVTREHVTVALSGDGGDESFAGYRRYGEAWARHRRLDRLPGRLGRAAARLAARVLPAGVRGQGYLEMLGSDPVERYFRMMTHPRVDMIRGLLGAEGRARTAPGGPLARFRGEAASGPGRDHVALLQHLDVRTYLPDDILTKVDRTSMLVSLEARVPLLDHVLMEWVAAMPTRLKFAEGRGKVALTRAMAAELPDEIRGRRKMGFGVPLAAWFRAELADYVRDVLLAPRTRERGLLDPRAIERLLAEHHAGRDHAETIWTLLALEEWARTWLDGRR
ncbi:MAG: asparagine synthase (glutamine-hydrolyzing) [Candidatus Rokubacteria bacterium]|nr:asparagine synthase (glutamine-hydrolyzing) [Candidatus Rokubacteria bacterium]